MSLIKSSLSVLALASAALAVPRAGHGHAHRGLHQPPPYAGSPSSAAPPPYGSSSSSSSMAPYPIGNSSVPYSATGTAVVTSSSEGSMSNTNYVTSTLNYASTGSDSPVGPATSSGSVCGGEVTVTTKIYETVTVTPGYSSEASSSKQTSTVYQTSTVPSAPAYSSEGSSSSSSDVAPVYSSESSAPVMPSYGAPTSHEAPASSSSSPSKASPTGYSGGGGGSGKRGMAYNDAGLTKCFEDSEHVGWAYNWISGSHGLDNAKWHYIPTLHDTSDYWTSLWSTDASSAIASGSKALFSFNEPDLQGVSPSDAAASYKAHMEPFAGQAELCAPAITNGGGAMGLQWLSEFMDACSGCTVDAINLHWYADAQYVDGEGGFITHLKDAYQKFNKPIYVTEFGTTGGDTNTFLQSVMPWMDSQDYVKGYAYFMVSDGLLVSGSEPSEYGKTYATYSG